MEWATAFPKNNQPTYEQVSAFINNECWNQFNLEMHQLFSVSPTFEHSACTMQAGWNIKYKKKGKNLCTIYPMEGFFKILLVMRYHPSIETSIQKMDESIQACYAKSDFYNGSKWLMFDIDTNKIMSDCLKLIQCKQVFL